jgi:peptide/nickel transport system substrate-binding protein
MKTPIKTGGTGMERGNMGGVNLVILALFLITFITGSEAMAVSRGGTLVIGQSVEPINVDPQEYIEDRDEEVIMMVYDNLVHFKKESGSLEFVPGLATRWENSPDGLTWTFHLRKGVNFHDGTPFNADAVLYYFNRALADPKTNKGWGLFGAIVQSAEAVDPYTVKVNMKKPHAFFLHRIAHGGAAIFSPTAHKKYGKELAFNPVGTGPFKFQAWVRGDHLALVANPDYWGGSPLLDRVILKPVKEEGTRMLQLQAGQINVTMNLSAEAIPLLKKDNKLDVVTFLSNQGIRLEMNGSKKPFDNILVRQALNYAVNREALAKHLYGGLAVPIPGAVSPAIAGYAEMRGYTYNPAQAKALLAKAGYPNGFTMTVWTTGTGLIMKDLPLCEALQKYFAAIGVTLKIEKMEWAAIVRDSRASMDKNRAESFLMKWPPSTGEATWMLQASCTKAQWPPVGSNRSFYDSPVFDDLLEKATSSADSRKRDAYLRAAQIVMNEDAPFVFLVTPMSIWGKSKKVHDMVFTPLSTCYASEKTWIEK